MSCWNISTFRDFIGPPDGNIFVVRLMFLSVAKLKKLRGQIMSKGMLHIAIIEAWRNSWLGLGAGRAFQRKVRVGGRGGVASKPKKNGPNMRHLMV
jgi:hypothetical protein